MNKQQLYKAILQSMTGRYAVYAVNVLSTIVLARIFSPEIFGIVASVMVFYFFFQLMAEAGLGPAIINLSRIKEDERDGVFGLTVITGFALGSTFYLLTPFISNFYNIPQIRDVIPYISVSLFFFAASIVPNAFLLRDQAFFSIAHAGVIAELSSLVSTVCLVKFVPPLHALASKGMFLAITNFIVTYYLSRYTEFGRPKLGRSFSAIKPLLSFSLYQYGFNFINYFSRNLDNILVGKYMGASPLGFYEKAYQLMRYPLMLLTFAMTPAIQPVIRQYADDIEKVEEIHRDFAFKLSLAGSFIGISIFFLSGKIVPFLLGDQWKAVVPIIKILSLSIPVQVVLSSSGSFFQAMNRPDLLLLSGVLTAIVMVTGIVWGVLQKDLVKLSWVIVGAFHLNFFQAYFIIYSRIYQRNFAKFLMEMLPFKILIIFVIILSFYRY